MTDLDRLIRDVPDFPKPGIVFKDITPLLADAGGLRAAIQAMATPWRDADINAVAGIESRGFILGAALAVHLGTGFVPIRKPGKLPGATIGEDYGLEYGHDRVEIHVDALPPGRRVLIVDDVLATGGTLAAARALVEKLHCQVAGAGVLLELAGLDGRARWRQGPPLETVLRYD
ncbi:MAG: adenine phosphoribosyltransferase [Xanthomonadales bacterium]|nr:adenine phosphoribosyltransferase [Xanthomonadales bacterium]